MVAERLCVCPYLELFDQHTRAKEKGSLHLNFRDQDPHFSPKYAQPC